MLSANAVSGFAQGISIIAIPWHFVSVLNKSSLYGVIFAVITFITLFWSLYVGTLVDKYSRKKIFLSLNVAGCLTLGTVAAIGFALGQVPELLIALAFGVTIFIFNVHYPTLYAFGQEITSKENYGKINSLLEVQGQTTSMLSGAFAAFLLGGGADDFPLKRLINIEFEPWSMQEIFLLDASTYALAFLLILMIKYVPDKTRIPKTGGILERLKTGLKFLKKRPALLSFGIATYAIFVTLLVQAYFLMSVYVSHHLDKGPSVLAMGEMLYAGGAIVAGLFVRLVFKHMKPVLAIIILMFITTGIYYACAFTMETTIFYGFCLVLGLTNAGTRVLRITFLFNYIPNQVIGRAGSIFNSTNILMRIAFISLFSLPFFSTGSNITWGYFILGTFVLVAIIPLVIFYGQLSKLKKEE